MTVSPTIKALAARIWSELPGDTPDKAHALKSVMSELRSIRDAAMVDHRRSNLIHAPHKLRTTTEHKLAKLIGKPPIKGQEFRVAIHGVNTPVVDVFRIAGMPDHPLQPACQAFLDEHRLSLTLGERKPGSRGRAPVVITQAPAPSPTPVEVLDRVKRATARFMGRESVASMTDHSGGKVSTVTVERGDGQ